MEYDITIAGLDTFTTKTVNEKIKIRHKKLNKAIEEFAKVLKGYGIYEFKIITHNRRDWKL